MKLHELFVALGEDSFRSQLRGISFGTLRTYQIYDRVKTRCHLAKLNTESLRTNSGRLWERLKTGEDELALELSQAILVSQLKLIIDVLDYFKIPHEDGFFAKETDPKQFLPEGWQQQAYDHFKDKYTPALVDFYLNHLAFEMDSNTPIFKPAS
ncbi:hypothetical protein [Bryobacter aggregatus]|uniref:hypothetical protein n=1 Tax=Bryobacter aggregatus TaxID=360054 RepID=UPI0004E1997D|nr:hypothetical protein [Bryobacter aggregatus]